MPGVQDEGRLSRVRWLPDPDTAVTLVSCVAANSLGQQVVSRAGNEPSRKSKFHNDGEGPY